MPEQRLEKTRKTLPKGYQFGNASSKDNIVFWDATLRKPPVPRPLTLLEVKNLEVGSVVLLDINVNKQRQILMLKIVTSSLVDDLPKRYL